MTKFAEGAVGVEIDLVLSVVPEDSVAVDPTLMAEMVVAGWDTFIPKLGGRVLQTTAELNSWLGMPDWQKDGLRFRDPKFLAYGPAVINMVTTAIRTQRQATETARQRVQQFYYQ